MMQDKDLTDDVLDEIIAGAKTSLEQYLALSLKAERAANRQQNEPQNIPEIIPGGLVEAVNNLLNNDGSRGRYSAIGCGEAREKIELWLAQRQKWESQRSENLCAGNSPVIPDCSCRTCRPVTFSDSRFVVCPECGNKRCPHANDHRNACTGSNEPGQEGSAYPAAPQQEVNNGN